MKRSKIIISLALLLSFNLSFAAEIDWLRAAQSAVKTVQAVTLTDKQLASYVKQSVDQMDRQNKVLPESSPYVKRLRKLTAKCKQVEGTSLNFKVYQTSDINAFACPDGSVRVYTGLMDIMNDDELMGVIGHEIGHVGKHHSRKALRNQLLTGALRDAIGASGSSIAILTDSQLGAIGESLMNAKYSRKQETEADNYGYDFLVKNGVNPYGMVSAFEKLDKSSGNSKSSYIQKMFSSHPDTKKRIDAMKKRCIKDGYLKK